MNQLPIYKIRGTFYYLDKRLNEYRNVNNPFDVLPFDKVSLSDLEKTKVSLSDLEKTKGGIR
jgi:hypothetical protein